MTPFEKLLYSEICAFLRRAMPLRSENARPLREAESRIAGVIITDAGMKCSPEAMTRSAWAFAERYVAENLALDGKSEAA